MRGCRRCRWRLSGCCCGGWCWSGSCWLRAEHRQKLWVFQCIQRLNKRFARHRQFLTVAKFVAVLGQLIFGGQMIGECERNGILAVCMRCSITTSTGDQRARFCSTAFEANCYAHIDLVHQLTAGSLKRTIRHNFCIQHCSTCLTGKSKNWMGATSSEHFAFAKQATVQRRYMVDILVRQDRRQVYYQKHPHADFGSIDRCFSDVLHTLRLGVSVSVYQPRRNADNNGTEIADHLIS